MSLNTFNTSGNYPLVLVSLIDCGLTNSYCGDKQYRAFRFPEQVTDAIGIGSRGIRYELPGVVPSVVCEDHGAYLVACNWN